MPPLHRHDQQHVDPSSMTISSPSPKQVYTRIATPILDQRQLQGSEPVQGIETLHPSSFTNYSDLMTLIYPLPEKRT